MTVFLTGFLPSSMEFTHKSLLTLKSPGFIPQTRLGTFFHLTPHNQSKLNLQSAMVNFCDFFHIEKVLQVLPDQKISFKKYIGQPESLITCLAPYDLCKENGFEVCNKDAQVRLLGQNGYFFITPEQYFAMARLMQPDIIVQLFDSVQNKGKKSTKLAFQKSVDFLAPGLSAAK